jgi:hypothetical protein
MPPHVLVAVRAYTLLDPFGLVDPKVFRIMKAEPGKGPRSLSALLPSIPKMFAAMIKEMI